MIKALAIDFLQEISAGERLEACEEAGGAVRVEEIAQCLSPHCLGPFANWGLCFLGVDGRCSAPAEREF